MAKKNRSIPPGRNITALLTKAARYLDSGQVPLAVAAYQDVLRLAPHNADALRGLGVLAFQCGDPIRATELLTQAALENTNDAATRFSLGVIYGARGMLEAAVSSYHEAIQLQPDYPEALCNLGLLLHHQGKLNEAAGCYQRAIAVNSEYLPAHYNLGNLLQHVGDPSGAAQCYRRVITLNPSLPEAYSNLGSALLALGENDAAIENYLAAIRANSNFADAHNNLGCAYMKQRKIADAKQAFSSALAINPHHPDAHWHLANALYEEGWFDTALESYLNAARIRVSDGAKIRHATAIPIIPSSLQEIDTRRAGILHNIAKLMTQSLTVKDPIQEIGSANFFLAYQGRNDREIQTALARLYLHACPGLAYTAEHCVDGARSRPGQRIKIGMISRYFKNHSIGKTSKGIIKHLDRSKFEVVVLFLDPPSDEIGREIASYADTAVVLPDNLFAARQRVAGLRLDILFYQDTGMDSLSFFMAFARLAPVQCTSFGHPVTTGIPNLDYYISTDYWEPEHGEDHYSEKLLRLRDVASVAYYYRPPLPSSLRPRKFFGLPENRHIYLCPQTLFKFHPDMDALFAGILRADPLGLVVLIEGIHAHWGEILRERFRRAIPDVAERIQFIPRQQGADYMNLLAHADVMLDTLHFCGFNTTLEGFLLGVPVVTLPGEFMRGRHTLAFYRKLGIDDCIASSGEDYVSIALRLGTDPVYRAEISTRITGHLEPLWEELAVVREYERVFEEVVRRDPPYPGGATT